MKLTAKQQRFITEYLIDLNATQAAIRAGYSQKIARQIGAANMAKHYISEAIKAAMDAKADAAIATQDEVLRYLTSVLREEIDEETVVVEGIGDGCSEARKLRKAVGVKDRNKAAELLGKRYGLFTERIDLSGSLAVKIVDDITDE